MRGVASTSAAITVVNALLTGVGAAVGVTIPARAEVELEPVGPGTSPRIDIARDSDTPIVRATLLAALRRFEAGPAVARLRIHSRIPPARGLKSSSAVGGAVVLAVARALHRHPAMEDVARLVADVALESHQSATGAFDDAMAGLLGGAVVTDNAAHRVLRHESLSSEWKAVLWIPRSSHRPSPQALATFRARRAEARAAVEAATRGDYLRAMDRNTELVERILGYDYRPLREECRRQGAVGSGVSGMGPTLAALVPSARASDVARRLPLGNAEVWTVDLRPRSDSAPEGSP